ncbi:MAG: TonB-dependent receptor [Verrucomicrobiota bacterium]
MLPLPFTRAILTLLSSTALWSVHAQTPAATTSEAETVTQTLPEILVTVPKLGGDLLSLPLSATVVSGEVVDQNAIRNIKDAALYAPNTFVNQFSARKLSNPYFRGIAGSPLNPGVTTFFDGVPQFNGNSSSLELLDVEQVDFIRGPQGALFGRNTVGGLINIASRRPSLTTWGGEMETTFGNYNLYDFRGRVTGPLIQDQLGFSFAGGYSERDGYTRDTVSGSDIDKRSAYFGKGQFLWTPNEDLEVRFILAGESSRDGDYALNDLAALRRNPRQSSRDFLGFVERDVIMPTLQVTYHAESFDFTSTTGFVWWETTDATDLDYGPFPLATRFNTEKMATWTQEFRFSNPSDSPITLSDEIKLSWQAGLFLFYADYEQLAYNDLNPPISPIPGTLRSGSTAELVDKGVGTYLQGTLTFWDRLDITAGLRWDYEDKQAALTTFLNPVLAPGVDLSTERSFSQVTPQAAISYRVTPDLLTYFSFAGGFKAGGFNPQGPVSYEEEQSWNYEIGLKGRALEGDLRFGLAAFYTDWSDLQLNQPLGGGQFFIANAGDATSQGIELDLAYEVNSHISVFGSASWQDTQFRSGSTDGGVNLAGNTLQYAPDYNVSFGTQLDFPVTPNLNVYARADVQFIGSFNYNAQNTFGQDAYTLANFRLGVRGKKWFAEAYVNNAFDTEYVPIAFAYDFAPSGAVGENGAPITFGLRAGIKF